MGAGMPDCIFIVHTTFIHIFYCALLSCSSRRRSLDHSIVIEWENISWFCFVYFWAQIGETDAKSVFLVFVFLLTLLVSTTHPLFQVTDNMSSSVGAEDSRAGRPFRRNLIIISVKLSRKVLNFQEYFHASKVWIIYAK